MSKKSFAIILGLAIILIASTTLYFLRSTQPEKVEPLEEQPIEALPTILDEVDQIPPEIQPEPSDKIYASPEKGISAVFINSYEEKDEELKFGPITVIPIPPTGITDHFYVLQFITARSSQEALDDLGTGPWYKILPIAIEINGLTIIKSHEEELCGGPRMEVVGKKHNYVLKPVCGKDAEAELEYLEKTIETFELSN